MWGLIIKDLYNLKRQLALYGIIGGVYLAVAGVSGNVSVFIGMIMMFTAMIPLSAIAYDERAKWDKYSLTMPVSRKQIVAGKYLLGLLVLAAGGALSLISVLLMGSADVSENLITVAVLLGVCLLYISILVPVVFKLGTERARYVMMIIIFVPFLVIVPAAKFMGGAAAEQNAFFLSSGFGMADARLLAVGFLLFSGLMLALSYRIAVSIYSKREL